MKRDPLFNLPKRAKSLTDKIRILHHLGHFADSYGYAEESDVDQVLMDVTSEKDVRFMDAVESFQRYGLDPDGETPLKLDGYFGPKTGKHWANRPCGRPDRTSTFDARRHNFGGGRPKWVGGPVRFAWYDGGSKPKVNNQGAEAWYAAVNALTLVCGIEVKTVPIARDSSQRWAFDVWAWIQPIDGSGGTLAWSYSPRDLEPVYESTNQATRRIQQRYDEQDASLWRNLGSTVTVDFHELLHAVHFDGHLPVNEYPGQIINPTFNGSRVTMDGMKVTQVHAGAEEVRLLNQAYPRREPPPPPGKTLEERVAALERAVFGETE